MSGATVQNSQTTLSSAVFDLKKEQEPDSMLSVPDVRKEEENVKSEKSESVKSEKQCGMVPKPVVLRRSKIKPVVKVKPRVATTIVKQTTSASDVADSESNPAAANTLIPKTTTDEKLSGITALSDSNNEMMPLVASTVDNTPAAAASTAESVTSAIAPAALIPIVSPNRPVVINRVPRPSVNKDVPSVCVIKLSHSQSDPSAAAAALDQQSAKHGENLDDGSVKVDDVAQATITRSQVVARRERAHSDSDTGATITKVLPARRSRMIKPRPNIVEHAQGRFR